MRSYRLRSRRMAGRGMTSFKRYARRQAKKKNEEAYEYERLYKTVRGQPEWKKLMLSHLVHKARAAHSLEIAQERFKTLQTFNSFLENVQPGSSVSFGFGTPGSATGVTP